MALKTEVKRDCAFICTHQASASALAGRAAHRGTEQGQPEPAWLRGGAHKRPRAPQNATPTSRHSTNCHTNCHSCDASRPKTVYAHAHHPQHPQHPRLTTANLRSNLRHSISNPFSNPHTHSCELVEHRIQSTLLSSHLLCVTQLYTVNLDYHARPLRRYSVPGHCCSCSNAQAGSVSAVCCPRCLAYSYASLGPPVAPPRRRRHSPFEEGGLTLRRGILPTACTAVSAYPATGRLRTPESYLGCMSAMYCLDALPPARSLARLRCWLSTTTFPKRTSACAISTPTACISVLMRSGPSRRRPGTLR